jgi:hypothetical protein
LHWQYGGATKIFSALCSLIGYSLGRGILSGNGINSELLYLYSAAAPGGRNIEYRHIANASTLGATYGQL